MSKTVFKQTLERYGKSFGLKNISYDDTSGTSINFTPDIELVLLWSDELDCALASVFCGHPSASNLNKLYAKMAKANHFWIETGGATLSFNDEFNAVFLADKWGGKIIGSPTHFAKQIDLIVNAAKSWIAIVRSEADDASYSSAQIPDSTLHQLRGIKFI